MFLFISPYERNNIVNLLKLNYEKLFFEDTHDLYYNVLDIWSRRRCVYVYITDLYVFFPLLFTKSYITVN